MNKRMLLKGRFGRKKTVESWKFPCEQFMIMTISFFDILSTPNAQTLQFTHSI